MKNTFWCNASRPQTLLSIGENFGGKALVGRASSVQVRRHAFRRLDAAG